MVIIIFQNDFHLKYSKNEKINNKYNYLLVQRKDTYAYVEFLRGKYDINNNEYITETLVTHKSLKFKETIKRTNLIEE